MEQCPFRVLTGLNCSDLPKKFCLLLQNEGVSDGDQEKMYDYFYNHVSIRELQMLRKGLNNPKNSISTCVIAGPMASVIDKILDKVHENKKNI